MAHGVLQNCAKPEGRIGKLIVRMMNSAHTPLSKWGLAHLELAPDADVIDLGCGGGRNVAALLKKYPDAIVDGIDYSPLSAEKAIVYNAPSIARKRCTISVGDVSDLQLAPHSYDLATAFETIYFWPGLEKCFAQVAGVLKPGGIFMICNESDGTDDTSLKYEKIIDGMKNYTAEQIEAALRKVGFSSVSCHHHPSKPWITVIAKK